MTLFIMRGVKLESDMIYESRTIKFANLLERRC